MAEETYRCEIHHLECHFKWFNELNIFSNGKLLSDLLNRKLHKDLSTLIDATEVDQEEVNEDDTVEDLANPDETDEEEVFILRSHRLKQLSWRFTKLLRDTFEGRFDKAFQRADKLLNLEEAQNPSQPQAHIDTFSYVVLADQLNILDQWRSTECPMDEKVTDDIVLRMKPLIASVETNEGKAFISGMKCYLSRDMYDEKSSVDFAKEATELNPLYAGWHDCLYKSLREYRRLTNYRQRPSAPEIDAAKKGYQLESGGDPNKMSMSNAVTMSLLYNELLFTCSRGSREHQETSDEAVKFARAAVALKPHSKRFKIRLAHLLSGRNIYRRFRAEGFAEAKKLIEECEVGECSSETCHKIGKFYCNEKYEGCDYAKGLEWFQKALKAHVGNFPCLMDMLRNEHFQRKDASEIISVIDNMLNSQNKHSYKCQLLFVKGFYLWITDKEATLDLWLMAMDEAADSDINFVALATGNVCFLKDRNRSQALSMMENVKVFMDESDRTNDRNFATLMGVVISVIANFERQMISPRYNPIVRGHEQRN